MIVEHSASAWEERSWAAWWAEDGGAAIAAREEAYRAFKDLGDPRGAARMALWLAVDHIEFNGEEAVAQGWFARCERILGDLPPSPEHGWLAAFQAAFAFDEGDSVAARALGAQARELGRELNLTALEMLGLATEGLGMVTAGEVDPGLRCLDEASAAALGGEYELDVPVCWTCCYLIYACEHVRDYDRAVQWCRKVDAYGERRGIRWVRRVCRAHYAGVLVWRGEWERAEQELVETRAALLATRPVWAPEAGVRLGELRRRQGRYDEAEQLLAESEPHLLATLYAGELALDRGRPEAAIAAAERLLRRLPEGNRTQRAGACELLVRAHAAAGNAATEPLAELAEIVAIVGGDALRAALRHCEGVAARAAGEDARAALEDAVALYDAAGAPFEAARARLELSDPRERQAAQAALARLGAVAPRRPDGPLSARELDVLRLVARGLTDKEIAAELVLSRHTVHRHVANIYAKLGCSTRAAAVARAADLLRP
jgi:ATP/maltotriose-dependent transcriptional regulator MalT